MGVKTRTKRHQEQRRIFSAQLLLSAPSCSPSPSSLPFVPVVVVDSTGKVNITATLLDMLRLTFPLYCTRHNFIRSRCAKSTSAFIGLNLTRTLESESLSISGELPGSLVRSARK